MALPTTSLVIPSAKTQQAILDYSARVLSEHASFASYLNKMDAIDIAYARYKASTKTDLSGIPVVPGVDSVVPAGVMNVSASSPPVVISQVDSMVAYLAEVFLSGSPLFPVVSNPSTVRQAEQLEVLIDDHATLGGYARQLLLFLRDGVKYNFSAIECDWTSIDQYSPADELLNPGTTRTSKKANFFSKIERWDPYNTVWDFNVTPGDVSAKGDYAGHLEILTRTKLKRKLQRLSDNKEGFNVKEATATNPYATAEQLGYYRMHPQVSDYVSSRKPISGMNWDTYLTGRATENTADLSTATNNYEVFTLYARIVPADFGMSVPSPRTVQIWKFVIVNSTVVVQAKRIISAYDLLPVLFGQPLEDGLGYQTQSIAEASIPFQQSATTLFDIYLNAARRAVADRALYNPLLISPSDANSPVPSAKIPVKVKSLDGQFNLKEAYHQIPFDSHGMDNALQAGMQMVGFGKEMSGLNAPQQGQFQRGNKSVKEWVDTMGGSEGRLRLPALSLEYQVFYPLRELLKLNILQYGDDAILVSQRTGKEVRVDIAELRRTVLSFRLADGYSPKSKLASTDAIAQGIQMLSQSPILQQAYGTSLPAMFAHLMQLMGVKGLEEYSPLPQPVSQPVSQPAIPPIGA